MSSKKRNYDSDSDSDFSSKRKKLDSLLNQIMKIQEKLKKKEKKERERERAREKEREREQAREIVKERERELEMMSEQDSEHLNNIAAYKCIINNMRITCPNPDSIYKDIRHISRKYAVQTFKNCGICDERFDGFKFGAHTQLDGELLITKSNLIVCQTCVYSTAIKSFGGNFGIACKYLIKY